ncbi:hypothetical protein MAPG_02471 [Magnaporthiopsis poae ATCC 64411]|uniref:Uncharacterized protein n=1 Tax=Magnaporthiopsis poae (strain ATCC 64411 / 73-15) TaxID=644358 RepID=A0A0C4DRG3_MAGP6|nr:hypothetical protein MAPG_02471 [Magnaporthiopsis poae ATCC 64411]
MNQRQGKSSLGLASPWLSGPCGITNASLGYYRGRRSAKADRRITRAASASHPPARYIHSSKKKKINRGSPGDGDDLSSGLGMPEGQQLVRVGLPAKSIHRGSGIASTLAPWELLMNHQDGSQVEHQASGRQRQSFEGRTDQLTARPLGRGINTRRQTGGDALHRVAAA